MPDEKQLQFREHIKAIIARPWDLEVELTMPGELTLYRDYKLTDVSEYASANLLLLMAAGLETCKCILCITKDSAD
jgi:hypothetical protein